jgi:endothelin-converting enzyme/putative endopeptidase
MKRSCRIAALASVAVALLAACASDPAPPPATPITPSVPVAPVPPPETTPVSGEHGIQLADLDRTADPCTDFYQFANGTWRAQNPIPASMQKWSRRWQAGEDNKEHLKGILEELSAKHDWPKGSNEQIVGDFYGACIDTAAADAQGVKPLAPLLAEIDAIKAPKDLQRVIEHLVSLDISAPFDVGATQDPHDPTQVIADVEADGLGMPDRDYYVKTEPRFVEARAKYRAHMAKMFELAGRKEPASALDAVFAFETSLAKATLDNVAERDPHNRDHHTALADLAKAAPHVDWARFLDDAGIGHGDLNVEQPAFVAELDHELTATKLATWKTYLAWRVLRSAGKWLTAPLATETFAFEEAYLGGSKEPKPRWKECAEAADHLFGEALGAKYVEKYFPPAAKARVRGMVDNLLAAMGDSLHELTWMSPDTKKRAEEKLRTFAVKVGYPDKWKDYSHVDVAPGALWPDVLAGRKFLVDDDRARIGKPVDRARWGMTPPTSDAYYNAKLNEIVFPAGILQPPAFDVTATDAVNYGAIGVVIGHEISHGFDDQGAKFDAQGKLENWWTPTDLTEFTKRGQCVSDQFDGYFVEPGIHHNGKLVLGESIGDLGGVRLAWRAFQRSLAGKPRPASIDGFTPEQQFFIAWGQFRGDAVRPEQARFMVQGDPHPIGKYRVLGPLSNVPDFAQTWSCKADAPMVRSGAQHCEVW